MSLGIYGYFDKKDNSCVYVGKDSNIHKNKRDIDHRSPSKYNDQQFNKILQNNPNRYTYQVLVWNVTDQKTLNTLETQYINQFNPKFNFTNGGDGVLGYKWTKPFSEEHRKKISEGNKGKSLSKETKKKIGEGNKGKTCSEETKKRMSEAKKGEKHPYYRHDIKVEDVLRLYNEGNSMRQISRMLNCSLSCIKRRIKLAKEEGYVLQH